MPKIKFWPNKDTREIEVEIELDALRLRFPLDLEEAYEGIDDYTQALHILESDWVDKL